MARRNVELVAPAGNLKALKCAVDSGADAVYAGFRGNTNARNFPGLNFSPEELRAGLEYARQRGKRLFLAVNTYPRPSAWAAAARAVDDAAALGVDALILADIGLLQYAKENHPDLRLHLSVQGSATNRHAIGFYHEHFGVRRVVLPRVLSLAQINQLIRNVPVEVEVFGYGSLCVMVEGRCALSSYVTGDSPNSQGVCSPAHAVHWKETPRHRESYLNRVLIDRYAADEITSYPTLCKGRFQVNGHVFHAIEEPVSLNILEILPQLVQGGIAAVKLEGRQRSHVYVARVTQIMRAALDACLADPERYTPDGRWMSALAELSEGSCTTLGAYHRPWQ
jgi:putative protease